MPTLWRERRRLSCLDNTYSISIHNTLCLQLIVTATTTLDAFYMLPMEPSNEEHVYNVGPALHLRFASVLEDLRRQLYGQ